MVLKLLKDAQKLEKAEGLTVGIANDTFSIGLRGANWSGLEYRELHGLTLQKLTNIKNQWNINILRFAFNREDYANNHYNAIYDYPNVHYRDVMRMVQGWCQSLGITIIFNLQWESTSINQSPLPDHNSTVSMWNTIAQDSTYKNNQLVWFDLWSEPHDCTISQWKTLANDSINAIRQYANNICLVAGLSWAGDLSPWRGNYLTQSNVVYSSHNYAPSWSTSTNAYNIDGRLDGVLSDGKPVFIGEFGADFTKSGDSAWLEKYALPWFNGIGRKSGIPKTPLGWTAWSMTDYPLLTSDYYITPTAYGEVVHNELTKIQVL